MKKLSKRLPALLLALMIAVMPLMMAVPVSAAYIEEYSYNGVVLPKLVESVNGYEYARILEKDGHYYLGFANHHNTSMGAFYSVYNGDEFYYVNGDKWERYTTDASVNSCNVIWVNKDLLKGSTILLVATDPVITYIKVADPPIILDPKDVLSVFSGVCSWLAGAIGNLTAMFWTAEGGLSVLGVLAVASLALAFILLLVWLIAGWLKFK